MKKWKRILGAVLALTLTATAIVGNATTAQAEESKTTLLHASLTSTTTAGGTNYGDMVEAVFKDSYITSTGNQTTLTIEFQDATFEMHNLTFDVYAVQTKAAGASGGAMGDPELATKSEGTFGLYTEDGTLMEPISVETGDAKEMTVSTFDRTTMTTSTSNVTLVPVTSVTFDITGMETLSSFDLALYFEVFNSAMAAGMQFSNYVNPTSGVDYSVNLSYDVLSLTSPASAGGTNYGEALEAIFDYAEITTESGASYLTIYFKEGTFSMHSMDFDVYALTDKVSSMTQGDSDLTSLEQGAFRLYTSADNAADDTYIEASEIQLSSEGITRMVSSFDRTTMTTTTSETTFYPVEAVTFDVTGMDDWDTYYLALYIEMMSDSAAAGMQFSNYVSASGCDYSAILSYEGPELQEAAEETQTTTEDSATNATEAAEPTEDIIEEILQEITEETSTEDSDTTDFTLVGSYATTSETTGNATLTVDEETASSVTEGSYEIVIPTTIQVDAEENSGVFSILARLFTLGENQGTVQITAPTGGSITSDSGSATYTNLLSGNQVATDGDTLEGTISVSDSISSENYYVIVDFQIAYIVQ